MLENQRQKTKMLVQTALFIAIGLVLRNFSYMVYVGGGAGMRLGVSGFFTKLPAFLFGPIYGGLCSAIVDFLGYVIRPDGAYIFPLTITAGIGGILTGFLYKKIKDTTLKRVKLIYFAFVVLSGILGTFNIIASKLMPQSMWGKFLNSFGTKTGFFTYGFFVLVALGLVFYIINTALLKKFNAPFINNYLKIFMVLLPVDIFITTVNTFILMAFIPALAKLGFWVFYLPRLAQELVSVFISSYAISYLLELTKKFK